MELKNPYAYIDEKLVIAGSAERGQHFTCPSCKETLILKRGEIKTAHFAHKPDMSGCSRDLITHQIAIDLLCKQSFNYEYICEGYFEYEGEMSGVFRSCEHYEIRNVGGHATCVTEYPIGEYRADIAILSDNNSVRGVIEVYNTHKTKKEKRAYFNKNKIACVEVDAQSVIDAYHVDGQYIECLFNNLHLFRDCEGCKKAKKEAQVTHMIHHLPWIHNRQDFRKIVSNLRALPILDDKALKEKCKELSNIDLWELTAQRLLKRR